MPRWGRGNDGMAREKKNRRKRLLPEDVLEGRVQVDALELYRLIHRVNPTNRRLARREAERRYDEKHKLQSFLVLHFGEEHVVVSRSEKEGVVRFDHPSGVFDACHAPLAELEPEARSWIQRRLDTEDHGGDEALPPPSFGDARDEAPDDPLSAARRALAEFDYAHAERLLTRAFDAGRGDVPLVVELLALKVETLGLDDEALALRPRLAGAARDDADVRSLLALAAARQGHGELAEKLASGLGDAGGAKSQERRSAVYAALGARAVEAGDEAAARRWLDELVDCDPFHEGVAAVRAGLERLAAAGRRESEEELAGLYRERGCLEAAAAAREVADRWPASEVARRILREAGELRRQTAVAEHLEIADRALAEEDFDTAVRHYEAVLAEDADVPDVPRRLGEARRGARERAEASAVDAVERRFAEDDRRRALLAYLELPEALRHRLRSRLEDEDARSAAADLDAVGAARPRLKATSAVDAVLALRTAEEHLAEDRAEAAWAALAPHRAVLAALPRTPALEQEIARRLIDERVKKNLELIRQVEGAFQDESAPPDPEKYLALLDEIDPDFLTPKYRQWVEMARVAMRQSAELDDLTAAYKSDLKAGQLFAARRRSRQFREIAARVIPAATLDKWVLPGRFLDDEIKRVWQLEHQSWRRGKALGPWPGLLQPRPGRGWRSESCGLDDEGSRLVVAQALVDWLFVTVVDVESGKVLERLSMNTPEALGAPLSVCWDGKAIRIGGAGGGVVVLEPEGWKIAEWEWLPRRLGKGRIERTVVLPRAPYVWVVLRSRGSSLSRIQVLERDAWRVIRKQTRVLAAAVLYGLRVDGPDEEPPPRVLLSGRKGTYLCAARGQRDPAEPLSAHYALAAAADGTGIVALLVASPWDLETVVEPAAGPPSLADAGAGGGLLLARFEPSADGWRLAREVSVAAATVSDRPVMAAAQGAVWFLVDGADGEAWLMAVEGETLEELYSLRVPRASALAGDRYGRHAVLLADGDQGPEVVRLGRGVPRLSWRWRPLAERRFPIVDLDVNCMSTVERGRRALKKYDALPASRRREHVLRVARESTAANIGEAALQAYVLNDRDAAGLAREYLAELHQRHPEQLDVAFLIAEWKCRYASMTQTLEDWKEALEMVLGIDPDWMTVFLRHFHHVQGMAYLLAGRLDEARESFEEGLRYDDGGCDLEPLLELVKPMKGKSPKRSEWNARHPLTRQLVGALRVATAALGRDDDKTAVAVLEHPAVWLAADTETLTRLSLAHVALVDDPADAGFEARLALSYLLEVIEVGGPRRIPPADLANAAQNLKDAGDTVREWLGIVAEAEAEARVKGRKAEAEAKTGEEADG